jgi:hypothetical protein
MCTSLKIGGDSLSCVVGFCNLTRSIICFTWEMELFFSVVLLELLQELKLTKYKT